LSNGANVPIVLVAMGGHAFMQKGEKGTIEDHERNARDDRQPAHDARGPGVPPRHYPRQRSQVGNLLIQHEMGREEVPPMPLDVLVAMTEGSLGTSSSSPF